MLVVLVTPYFASHGGGVESVAGRLARELTAGADTEIAWYASAVDAPPPNVPRALHALPMSTINVVERLTGLPFPIWTPVALRHLSAAIAGADAVHVHDFAYPSSLAALWLACRQGVPVVLTQHTGAVRPGSSAASAVYWLLQRLFARRAFEASGAVVFVSATSLRYWQDRLGLLSNAVTVWNGVDAAAFPPSRPAEAAAGSNTPVVLFVGRLVRKKGLEIVRRAAAALPHVRFQLAGRGPVDPTRWGLANVQVLGQVGTERLRSLYFGADLLLLPSFSEGFPLVVQEALVHGLAVLSTDEVAAACPPAAALMRSCAVPRDDREAGLWIAALTSGLADRGWIDDRRRRAEAAAALWSWPACASAYRAIFRHLADLRCE